jgi:serine/tyrosine/threonine adenylyltransferase
MEAYDPGAVFSSIDHGARYAYANQPLIARWNIARLAETLLPLLADEPDAAVARATEVIDAFPGWYEAHLVQGQRAKLGLSTPDDGDVVLAADFLGLLHAQQVDFTVAWRRLADAAAGQGLALRTLFSDTAAVDAWLDRWQARCAAEGGHPSDRAIAMRQASPIVIPRNHRVEEALAAATEGDLGPFKGLLSALQRPFVESVEDSRYAEPAAPAVTACYKTFCGT